MTTPTTKLITLYGLREISDFMEKYAARKTERREAVDEAAHDAIEAKYADGLRSLEPLEIELLCIRGKMGGWRWAIEEAMERTFAEKTYIPQHNKEYPLFDYGTFGPVGHLRRFSDYVWDGEYKIEWTKKVGREVVHNHFLQRCAWDMTNRTQDCNDATQYNMICGPMSCGKTFAAAWRILLLFYAFPRDFMAKVCSISKGGAGSRVWAEVVSWHERSIYFKGSHFGGRFQVYNAPSEELLFLERVMATGRLGRDEEKETKDHRRGIELVALPRSATGKGAVRQLKGMRQKIKIWVIDEATDVDPSAFDAEIAANWLVSPFLSQIVYLANPTHDSSAFVDHYLPKDENEYYDPESPGWATRHNGWVTNLNGLDSPNREWRTQRDRKRLAHEHISPFPYLSNITSVEATESRAGGRETCAFMSQAVGFLPSTFSADAILTLPIIQSAGALGGAEWAGEGTYMLNGNDPAFGGDEFVSAFGLIGMGYTTIYGKRVKRVIMEIFKAGKDDQDLLVIPFVRADTGGDNSTPEERAARWLLERQSNFGIRHLSAVSSDCTGTSRGFVHLYENMAKEKYSFAGNMLHRVGWKEKCSERPEMPDDPSSRKAIDAYQDSSAELLMSVRHWIPYIRNFKNQALIDQFSNRRFSIAAGNKVKVQTKDEFRDGVAAKGWSGYGDSPNEMDAVAVLVDLARQCGLGTEKLVHPSHIEEGGRLHIRRRNEVYGIRSGKDEGWRKIKAS